jgi:hypothetical protein
MGIWLADARPDGSPLTPLNLDQARRNATFCHLEIGDQRHPDQQSWPRRKTAEIIGERFL